MLFKVNAPGNEKRMMARLACLTVLLTACWPIEIGNGNLETEVRALEPLSGLDISAGLDVDVVLSAASDELELTCDDNLLDNIRTNMRGGVLVVDVEPAVRTSSRCSLYIQTTGTLEFLDVSGSGDITVQNPARSMRSVSVSGSADVTMLDGVGDVNLSIDVSGSGSVDVGEVHDGDVRISISGSGHVSAYGHGQALDVAVSGSATTLLGDLQMNNGEIEVSGSGDVEAYLADSVRVRVSGSGSVAIDGRPAERNVDTSGSGDVTFL